jgi:hypothetical protein
MLAFYMTISPKNELALGQRGNISSLLSTIIPALRNLSLTFNVSGIFYYDYALVVDSRSAV